MNLEKTQGGIARKFPTSIILKLLCQHGFQNLSITIFFRQKIYNFLHTFYLTIWLIFQFQFWKNSPFENMRALK